MEIWSIELYNLLEYTILEYIQNTNQTLLKQPKSVW